MEEVVSTSIPLAEEEEKGLSKGDIISYGMGGVASTMPSIYKSTFAMNFMTDVAGLNIAAVGAFTMLMTIWDAVNDPIIGGMADRTNTKRWGKYRPHMMVGSVLLAIVLMLMFIVPDFSESGKLTYYVIILALYSVFITQFTVPWQALNSVMSTDPEQRNLLLTSRQLGGFISGSMVGIITLPIVGFFSDARTGFFVATAVVSVIGVSTGLISAYGARKTDYYNSIPTPAKINLKEQLDIIVKNRAIIALAILFGLVNLIHATGSAVTLYYLKYVVKNTAIYSVQSSLVLVRSLALIPVMPLILRRVGKIRTLLCGMVLYASTSAFLFFLRENATPTAIVAMSFVSGCGFTLANIACISMIPDCTDYTELHFGTCQPGFINAIVTFIKKFCGSFSTMIVGTLLAFAGYSAGQKITPEIVNMIIDIKIWTPVVLALISLAFLKIYPITPQYAKEMRAKLKEIRVAR